MSVKIEAQHSKTNFTQCHNCQLYGHSQSRCKAPSVCVKCAGQHHTSQCTKTIEIPPICANCSGNHPASFQGCPRHPKVLTENATIKKNQRQLIQMGKPKQKQSIQSTTYSNFNVNNIQPKLEPKQSATNFPSIC